jgi:hypothetical protein
MEMAVDDIELTREQLSVSVALAKGTGRRIYDRETIKVHQALLAGGWSWSPPDPLAAVFTENPDSSCWTTTHMGQPCGPDCLVIVR